MNSGLWFGGWLLAMAVLFHAALRMPEVCWTGANALARLFRVAAACAGVVAVAVFANLALVRHDHQLDLTAARTYTPDADAVAVVDALTEPVRLTYFYRGDDPSGLRAKRLVEDLGRRNPYLEVDTTDPDVDPSLARTSGVRLYNAALLETADRRLVVRGTDEREIVVGIERLLGRNRIVVCFMTGHDEYPSDNEEFHTHVEVLGGAGHDHGAHAVVETAAHGVGRLRRSLEALGYAARDVSPAVDAEVDRDCNVLIDAGPRTAYDDIEVRALRRYLRSGGSALLLYDLTFPVGAAHAGLLDEFGIVLEAAVVTDDVQHYAGDPEMVAATSYPAHPVTANVSFAFFPGVRPLRLTAAAPGVTRSVLVESSGNAVSAALDPPRVADHGHAHDHDHDHEHEHRVDHEHDRADEPNSLKQGPGQPAGPLVLAAAIEGAEGTDGKPFRVVVVGDGDFASNSFFPYMSNSRLALSMVRWLVRAGSGPTVDPRRGGRESIELDRNTRRALFALFVIALPGLVAAVGLGVWWRRR